MGGCAPVKSAGNRHRLGQLPRCFSWFGEAELGTAHWGAREANRCLRIEGRWVIWQSKKLTVAVSTRTSVLPKGVVSAPDLRISLVVHGPCSS